ncbi:MAG: SDR family oxidoreductase [Geobacter sp.]|nr:SDR family oxidoreductase [Geobacter sp.]
MQKKTFIIGCGTIGRLVARLAMEQGWDVSALTRSAENAASLQALNIRPIQGNLDDPESLQDLPVKDAVAFYFAPPPGGGFTDTRVRSFCSAIRQGEEPARVIYISTSGVYGDCGDRSVTEETPVNPQTARARRRYDAETALLDFGRERNIPVVILRVTGIYGPGRLPYSQILQGVPVLEENIAPLTNRIHSFDLARICMAAAERGEPGDIFNVSDGHPSTMTSYFNAVADHLGLTRPPQVSLEEAQRVMPPLMLSYFSESRRMDNDKMLRKLGIELLYPTLKEGLKACGEAETTKV